MGSSVPNLDLALRQRLTARYGNAVEGWFETLPALLTAVAERWELELGSPIPFGNSSAVFPCRMQGERRAVLKTSPDRPRLIEEASALTAWHTVHSPGVIAFDPQLGALLLEAIEPGTPLIVSKAYPDVEHIAGLLRGLHGHQVPEVSYQSVAERVDALFRSSTKLYERDPKLGAVISFELFERGHALATKLARDNDETVLLHGDLTPRNILVGGLERGLVAVDPTPCCGDAAFDAIDLILWQADDMESIQARAQGVAEAIGVEAGRLYAWCCAFGGMVALELASEGDVAPPRIDALQRLASLAD